MNLPDHSCVEVCNPESSARHPPAPSPDPSAFLSPPSSFQIGRMFRADRVEVLLCIFLWFTYAYFYQSSQHNEAARFDQTRAILQKGVLYIDEFARYNTADVVTIRRPDGTAHVYPNKAPGSSLLALPAFALWMLILKALPIAEWLYWHWVAYLTTITTVGLLSALAALAMYAVLRRATGERFFSLLAVVAVWLGTICFPFSTLFFSHQQAAAQLVLAFWILFRHRHEGPGRMHGPLGQIALAGALCGFTVATEYPTVLLVVLLTLYFISSQPRLAGAASLPSVGLRRSAAAIAALFAGEALGLAVLGAYNLLAFGKWFYIPYEAYAEAGAAAAFPGHARGYVGVYWPGWRNFLDVLQEITIRPQRGLLYVGMERGWIYACNPVLWLALPGLVWLFRQKRFRVEAVLVAAMASAYFAFNACYGDSIVYWGGAWSVGPRHLVPMIPFLALPLAFAVRRWWFVFAPLLLLSIFYMLLATAVEPRVPYEYRNPARDLFLPNYLRGNFSLNRLGLFDPAAHPVVGSSTAFNLGEIAGLPGTLQLLPLLLFWLISGASLVYLTAGRSVSDAGERRATADLAEETSPARQPPRIHPEGWKYVWIAAWFLFLAAIAVAPPLYAFHQKRSLAKGGGLLGKYYANRDWKGPPAFERKDAVIEFDWTLQMPLPAPFSVEWFGRIRIDRPGRYDFALESDDGSWLAFDNKIILANGGVHARRRMSTSLEIPRAGVYPFAVRYFNEALGGMIRATWKPPGLWEQTIPSDVLSPPAIEDRPK